MRRILFIITFLLLFGIVSSAPPATTVQNFPEGYSVIIHPIKNYFKVGEDVNFHIHVFNSSNGYPINQSTVCYLHLYYSNGTQIVAGHTSTVDDLYDYEINTLGGNITENLKSYHVFCFDGDIGGDSENTIEVTPSGEEHDITTFLSYIVLFISVLGVALLIKSQHDKTDFNSFEKNIISNKKHTGETLVKGLLGGLFKNSFIWLYFIGWILVLIMREIIYNYGSVTVYSYFVIIANIYSLGLFLVVIYMIGFMIQYLKEIFSMISEDNWGIGA